MNRGVLRSAALILVGAALLACDPGEPSDGGQYLVVAGVPDRLGRDSDRVLLGSTFDLQLISARGIAFDDPDELGQALQCVDASASGALTQLGSGATGGRFAVASPGPGAVEFSAPDPSCPGAEAIAEFEADRWSILAVEGAGLRGAWVIGDEGGALDWGMSPGPAASFAPGFAAPSDTLRVVANGSFTAVPVLLDPSASAGATAEAEVRYNASEAALEVPGRWKELAGELGSDGEFEPRPSLFGRLSPAEGFTATLQLPGLELPLPPVEAVPVSDVVSLELVPVYWPAEADQNQREWGPPVAVAAIARDADGQRVFGAPIEWSVTRGRVRLDTAEVVDNVGVSDCKATPRRPNWRGATIEATLGDLVASTELEWVALPGDDTDPEDPLCTGSACDCSSGAPGGGSGVASLGLLVLGVGLRRRRRARR